MAMQRANPARFVDDDDESVVPAHNINLQRIAQVAEAKKQILDHPVFQDILLRDPFGIQPDGAPAETGHKARGIDIAVDGCRVCGL